MITKLQIIFLNENKLMKRYGRSRTDSNITISTVAYASVQASTKADAIFFHKWSAIVWLYC